MKFIILGCGSSMGVPRPDGKFVNCNPKNKKNFRTRCSALLKTQNQNILIDTSPDLRQQLINNNIKKIDKVLYSHMHADQTHGINDLRIFYLNRKKPIPTYADIPTSTYLKKNFSYCFNSDSSDYPPILKLIKIKKNLKIKNGNSFLKIKSCKVSHGKVQSVCYLIDNKIAYISDVNEINKKFFKLFKNLKFLVIDCLRYKAHPSHLNLEKALNYIRIFNPKKAILTNLSSDLDYEILKKTLPRNVIPAYDGLTLKL